jgi:hypothetical protein
VGYERIIEYDKGFFQRLGQFCGWDRRSRNYFLYPVFDAQESIVLKGEGISMKKEKATKAITVRVSEKEFKALKDIAKKTGQSLSSTVRNVIQYDIIKYAQKNNALRMLMNKDDDGVKKGKKK